MFEGKLYEILAIFFLVTSIALGASTALYKHEYNTELDKNTELTERVATLSANIAIQKLCMALTPSNMIPLGTVAPAFALTDTGTGKLVSLNELKGEKATVIMFICNHCPYVKHVNPQMVRLANDYLTKGVNFIAISSNDIIPHLEDSPDKMKETAMKEKYPFPYLYDETQQVAKDYDAACTPDFYIFDKGLKLVYRGHLDDSRPSNNVALTGKDIRAALDNLLAGQPVSPFQRPSIGCNIKWK
jgi:thiol-disulfide isomerase/thioredoxin